MHLTDAFIQCNLQLEKHPNCWIWIHNFCVCPCEVHADWSEIKCSAQTCGNLQLIEYVDFSFINHRTVCEVKDIHHFLITRSQRRWMSFWWFDSESRVFRQNWQIFVKLWFYKCVQKWGRGGQRSFRWRCQCLCLRCLHFSELIFHTPPKDVQYSQHN